MIGKVWNNEVNTEPVLHYYEMEVLTLQHILLHVSIWRADILSLLSELDTSASKKGNDPFINYFLVSR